MEKKDFPFKRNIKLQDLSNINISIKKNTVLQRW